MAPGTYVVEIPSRAFTRWIYLDGATTMDFDVGANSLTGTVHGTGSLREVSVLLKGNYIPYYKISDPDNSPLTPN